MNEGSLAARLCAVWRSVSLDLTAPRSPLPLALLRVALGIFVWFSPEPTLTRHLAQYLGTARESLLIAPEGLEWLIPTLRACAPYLVVVHWALRVSAVAVSLGAFTRYSLGVLLTSSAILFGGAQLTGTVTHNMHLMWMMAVLLAGPKELGLSVDSWLRKAPQLRPSPSLHATASLLTARALLGCIYLFPGLAKLRESGLEWALSDNLVNQMRIKWFLAGGETPWPRLDQWPGLVEVMALGALAFELGFVVLIWFRGGRLAAGLLGLLFHGAIAHFMYIHFVGLWGCYVVLWDGPRRDAAGGRGAGEAKRDRFGETITVALSQLLIPGFVAVALLVPVIVQGARGRTQAWPFACYPDFAHRAANYVADLAIDVQMPDGTWRSLRAPRRRAAQEWGTVWKVLGLYDRKPDARALRVYAERWLSRAPFRDELNGAVSVRYVAERFSIAPEDYGAPPLSRQLVLVGSVPAPGGQ